MLAAVRDGYDVVVLQVFNLTAVNASISTAGIDNESPR